MSALLERMPRLGRKQSKGAEPLLEAPAADRRRVRFVQLVVSLAIMVASVLLGWLLVQSQSELVEVWVVRERAEAGQTLEATDVLRRAVEAGSTLSAIEADEAVVGRTVRVAIPAGAALVEGHFFASDDGVASAGSAQMSLVFETGRITESVARNDLVRIVVVPDDVDEGSTEIFDQVPVIEVKAGDRGGFLVTVEVPVDTGDQMVEALSAGEAWASVVGRR